MEFFVPEDLHLEKEYKVSPETTAKHLGSGSVLVLSTPSMILFMEQVARMALDEVLPDELTSVGIEVCVKHLKAVPVGEVVKSKISISSVDNRKIIFEVVVTHQDKTIGTGTHTRFVVDRQKFLDNLG